MTQVLFDRLKSNLAQCINDGTIYFVTDSNGNFTQIALGDGSKSHVVGIGPKMDDTTKQELMSKLGLTISSNMGTIQLGKLANHNGVSSQKVVTYERTGLGTDTHEISTVGYVQQYMKTAQAMVYAGVFNAQTKEITDYNNAIISPSEEGNVTFDYLLNGNEGETLLTSGMSFIVGTAGNLEGYTGISVYGGQTKVEVGDMIIIINVQQKEGNDGGSNYNEASILIMHNKSLDITEFETGIIYDVSAHNDGAIFESLSALLSDGNLSTLIPTSVRRGGMSIKFIQSSDNKYVQYRLMNNQWSEKVTDWQGVEDEPILNSKNIPTSSAVAKSLLDIDYRLGKEKTYIYGSDSYSNMMLIQADGYPRVPANIATYNGIIIPIVEGVKYKLTSKYYSVATSSSYPIAGDSSNVLRINFISNNEFTAEENEKYLLVSLDLSISTTVSITVTESGLFRRVSSLESYIPDLYNRGFIITKAPLTYSNFIIDAYIPDYDANYLYYIDMFYWKHSEYGTRIRIKKENKLDHTISDLVYATNFVINNDDVQILDITSSSKTVAKLVINTKKLYDGFYLANTRIEFSDNVGVEHGLYLSNEEIRTIANSSSDKAEQAQGLAEQTYADNSKTTNESLLRKSINLFDGEFVNSVCNSTTGILINSSFYKTTKNSIPITIGQTLVFSYTNSNGKRKNIGGFLQEYADVEGTIPILRDTRLSENIYKCTDDNVKSIRIGFRTDTLDVSVDAMEYMIYVDNVYANIYKQQASSTYPQYVPIGYLNELDSSKNTLPGSLTGKKVICFGDSITAYGFYPQYAGLICGADIKNCGVGGTWLTHRVGDGYDLNTAWGKFSGDALADSISSGDFSAQVEAANYIYTNAKIDVRRDASELVSTDWNNVNIVTFAFCTNDYNNTSHVEGTIDSMDSLTYRGAINYIVNKIQTVYPHIKIIFICPPYRVYPYGHSYNMTDEEYKNSSYLTPGFEDSDTWGNVAGYTLKDIIKIIEEQSAINHCGCLNMYYNFGINKYTYLRYLEDGTHLTYDGYREYGSRLAKFLMSN